MAAPLRNQGPDQGASTRERVLAAALAGFAQRGVEATSLDALAAEVGIRKQTILYYFPSKQELLRGVVERATASFREVLGHAAAGARTPRAQRAAVVDAVFRLGARQPDLLVLLREVSRLGPDASGELAAALEPLVGPAVAGLGAEGIDADHARRVLLTAGAKVVGLATEVELLRDLGIPPGRAALRRHRRELLAYLDAELG